MICYLICATYLMSRAKAIIFLSNTLPSTLQTKLNMKLVASCAFLFCFLSLALISSSFALLLSPHNITVASPGISQDLPNQLQVRSVATNVKNLKRKKVIGLSTSPVFMKELPKGTNLAASPNDVLR